LTSLTSDRFIGLKSDFLLINIGWGK